MTLQEKLRKIRQDKGLSLQNMGDDLGISYQSYGNIESGKTDVNYSRLLQIAGVFKMSIIEVMLYGEDVEEMDFVKSKIEYHKDREQSSSEDMVHWRKQAMTLAEQLIKLQDEKEELKEEISALKKNLVNYELTSTKKKQLHKH
jgi:transcriptional regulator with XRE-family HTH domain